MPKWQPAPEPLVRQFHDAIAPFAEAEVRKMFGYPAAFRAGNMFAGLFQSSLIVRLGPDEGEAALLEPHVKEFDITGRRMKGWVLVAPEGVADDDLLERLDSAGGEVCWNPPCEVKGARSE